MVLNQFQDFGIEKRFAVSGNIRPENTKRIGNYTIPQSTRQVVLKNRNFVVVAKHGLFKTGFSGTQVLCHSRSA